MREFARRGFAFIFAFLLVATASTSGVVPGASPVGDAQAVEVFQDCGIEDSITFAILSGFLSPNDEGMCRFNPADSTEYENVSKTDAFASYKSHNESLAVFVDTTSNFQQDAKTVAWTKAKMTLINELNNGSSKAQAVAAANQTVEDYYARHERQTMVGWNVFASHLWYIQNSTPLTIEIGGGYSGTFDSKTTKTKTLVNGSDVVVYELTDTGGTTSFSPWDVYQNPLKAENPDTLSNEKAIDTERVRNLWVNYRTQTDQVKSNVDAYADGLFAEYESGELNSTDIARLNPTMIASEAATEHNSTGYMSFAAIQLAAMGYSGDLNASHTVTVNGTTLNGTLFYTGNDSSTGWETGQTYEMGQYNGTFYMAYQPDDTNQSSDIVDLSTYGTNFTIESAVNTNTGESVNTTQPQQYVYASTNVSDLDEELDQLAKLRQEYEDSLNGGGSSGGLNTQVIGGALLVGAAAVLLIQREGNK
ncbi:hypothetical protein [Haloferax prahovense]|uniref:hypothetical protein n=1 Tax=Haloferax prahovense TaxID=381852 RepID=UPI000679DA26|nr:hypothetical protein [Haloferax prahovense]